MRLANRLARSVGYAAAARVAGLACVACGGDVALNGPAPVDAGPTGEANGAKEMTPRSAPDASSSEPLSQEAGGDDSVRASTCGSSNCNGCCDAAGYCQPGDQNEVCGSEGGACQACASPSPVCNEGVCSQPAWPPCGLNTCLGCCDVNDDCVTSESSSACGSGGGACQDCANTNLMCADNSCVTPVDGGARCSSTQCTASCPAGAVCQCISSGQCARAETFDFTGAPQTFVVPAGIIQVTITASGAPGDGCGTSPVGLGGTTTATIPVTPGETLVVVVGGIGTCGGSGGFNGGGPGGSASYGGGDGGGASDVRQGGSALANRIVIAGGGGGANGGAGGSTTGAAGGDGQSGAGGAGGSQNAGGQGGVGCVDGAIVCPNAHAGTLGMGGAGGAACGPSPSGGGGGGGGGYFGGGGGSGYVAGPCGGGGGGSSYAEPMATGVSMQQGVWSNNGQVVITWVN
jgi:hypothetical protein